MLAMGAIIAIGAATGTLTAWAFFSDPSSSQTNSFTAATIAAPTGLSAVMTSTSTANLSWTAAPTLTGYALSSQPSGGITGCSATPSAATSSCALTGLTPGTSYTWSLVAMYDNWSSPSVATPGVVMSSPANGTVYGTDWSGALTGTASTIGAGLSIANVVVSVQQGSGASNCWSGSGNSFTTSCPNWVPASGTTSWSLALPSADLTSSDTYTVIGEATDSAGNVGSSAASFTYNTSAPSSAFTFPLSGGDYSAAAWALRAPIAGTLTGTATSISPSSVSLSIAQSSTGDTWNGTAFTLTSTANTVSPTYSAATGAFSYNFPSTDFPAEGTYSASISGTDQAGNTGTATVNFTYDNSTPVASVPGVSATTTYGTNPVWVNHETVTLTDSPTDPGGSGVASVTYYWCASSVSSCTSSNGTPIGSSSTGPGWSVAWSSLPSDGQYDVVAVATGDNTVVSSASAATLVGVDTTAPTVLAPTVSATVTYGTNPIYVKSETVTLKDPATDAGSGVNSVSYYYCSGSSGSCNASNGTGIGSPTSTGPNYSVTWNTPLPADGPYQIVAVATDNVNNTSTSTATLIDVDTTAPTVSTPIVNGYS